MIEKNDQTLPWDSLKQLKDYKLARSHHLIGRGFSQERLILRSTNVAKPAMNFVLPHNDVKPLWISVFGICAETCNREG